MAPTTTTKTTLLPLPLAMLAIAASVRAAPPPAIDKHVVDAANVLDDGDESDLADEVKRVRDSGGQMAVLLVTSTGGVPIDDYAADAARAWGGGAKARDDGILLVIATDDRRVRLEPGDGIEARLTESEAKRIIDRAAPSFRGSRWREGAGIVVNGVATRLASERMGIAPPPEDQTVQGMLLVAGIVAALVILVMLGRAALARRRSASTGPSGNDGGNSNTGGGGSF